MDWYLQNIYTADDGDMRPEVSQKRSAVWRNDNKDFGEISLKKHLSQKGGEVDFHLH